MASLRRRTRTILLLAWACVCIAQRPAAAAVDSVRTSADTVHAIPDSLVRHHPLPIFPVDGADTLVDQHLLLEHASNETVDALHWAAPFLALDPFAPGTEAQLILDGLDTRNIAVRFAGRPLNDPLTGRASLFAISPDLFERLEGTRAPHAAVDGSSADASLDVVPRTFNTNRPYVLVRYEQRPAEYIASGIEFSQNIARPLNFAFGVTRESQTGAYTNSSLEFWNVRGSLRWFPDPSLTLFLHESFTHNMAGEYGGLYPEDVLVNASQARVYLDNGYTDMARHDVTAGGRWQPQGDSTLATDVTAYVSTIDRSFTADTSIVTGLPPAFPFAAEDFHEYTTWFGMEGRQTVELPMLTLHAGISAMRAHGAVGDALQPVAETRGGAYADATFAPVAGFSVRPFARFDRIGDRTRPAIGAEASATIGSLSLRVGLARTERVPTPQERAWNGPVLFGAATANERQTNEYAGVRWRGDGLAFSLDINARTIDNAITVVPVDSTFVIRNAGTRTAYGAAAGLHVVSGWFESEANGQVTVERDSGVQLRRYPVFVGTLGLYYHTHRFFGFPLEVKGGVETWAASGFVGERYLPSSGTFVPAIGYETGPNGALDWIVMVHLGSAYIRVGVTNAFARRPYLIPYYPELWQAFHLGVTWALYD